MKLRGILTPTENDVTPLSSFSLVDLINVSLVILFKSLIFFYCRWYCAQGCASSAFPVYLPYSLRACFATDLNDDFTTSRAGSWNRDKSSKNETKSILHIVKQLFGRSIPGIPTNPTFPAEKEEKLKTIMWLYSSLLTFLR